MASLNLTDDLAHTDGTQTVTLKQAGTLAEQTVAGVLRRAVSLREMEASGGTFQHGDAKFHLPNAGLTFVPAADDTLVDEDNSEWSVLAVDLLALESRYRLWCRFTGGTT